MGSTYNWILISAFAFKLLWYLTLDEVYEETMALHKCIAGKRKRISNSLFTSAAYRRMTIVSRKSIVQWFQLWVEVPAFLTDHQVFLKVPLTDVLRLLRLVYLADIFLNVNTVSLSFREKLEVFVANNKIWTFKWKLELWTASQYYKTFLMRIVVILRNVTFLLLYSWMYQYLEGMLNPVNHYLVKWPIHYVTKLEIL